MAYEQKKERYYEKDGKKYVSVTTFLSIINKPGLNFWRAKVGNEQASELAKAGADIGSEFHFIVDQLLRGKMMWTSHAFQTMLDQQPEVLRKLLRRWHEWYSAQPDKVLSSERTVFSDLFGYAGQLDAETNLRIWDWKTSNFMDKSYVLQAHDYSFAAAEESVRENFPSIKNEDVISLMRSMREYHPKDIAIYNAHKQKDEPTIKEVPFDWYLFDVSIGFLNGWRWDKEWKWPRKLKKGESDVD